MYRMSSVPPPLEYSQGCIVFVICNHPTFYTKYLHFFEVSTYTTLYQTVVRYILDVWILVSVVESRNRRHIHLLPK